MIDAPSPDKPYDPAAFWATVGGWYEDTCDLDGYRIQEDTIAAVLEPLEWRTVLDVGCGFGRLGMMIQRLRPEAEYTGIDICAGLLESARQHVPDGIFHQTAILDFKPRRTWDLIITAEVLMHQPAADIRKILRRLRRWSNRWVLSCDWDAKLSGDQGNSWNIPHDYPWLYGGDLIKITPAGIPRQSVFLVEVM